jgi:hypothetical protein
LIANDEDEQAKESMMNDDSAPPANGLDEAPKRIRRRTGGAHFSWAPESFDAAKYAVDMARLKVGPKGAELARVMPHVIAWLGQNSETGGLECPSPAHDPSGRYRVGLDAEGRPQIQRCYERGEWLPVEH